MILLVAAIVVETETVDELMEVESAEDKVEE